MIRASEPSARAKSAFCWLPPDNDRIGLAHVRCMDLEPLTPGDAHRRLGLLVHEPATQQLAERGDRDVLRDRPQREDPVGVPVAGHDRDRAVDRRVATRPVEDAQQHLGLALSREARQSDDLAFMGDEADRLAGPWVRAHSDRQVRAIAARRDPLRHGLGDVAHRPDERFAVEGGGAVVSDDEAVAHDDDPVCRGQDLSEEVRDEDRRATFGTEPAYEREKLARDDSVEAGCRLIEDDEPCRPVGDGEGPRDLHHLPPGEGEVADDLARRDAVTREDRVERAGRSGRPLPDATEGLGGVDG